MADYLSRHMSKNEGAVAKAEELFNDLFTLNVLDEISPKLPQSANPRKPIKSQEIKNAKRKLNSGVLTIYQPVQTIDACKEAAKTPISKTMTDFRDLSKFKISNDYVKANAENERKLEIDPKIEIEHEDFSDEVDSTILIRERVRGTMLEGACKRVKGKVVGQSEQTITVLTRGNKSETVYSERDVAKTTKLPSTSKMPKRRKGAIETIVKQNKNRKGKRNQDERDIGKWSTSSPFPDEGKKIVNSPVNNEETEEGEEMETQSQIAEETERNETEPQLEIQKEEAQNEEERIDELPKIPVKGTVKWKKRSSERVFVE